MARSKELSVERRVEIYTLHYLGFSNREIGRRLSISEYSVRQTIKRKEETGSFHDRNRSGRPRSTTKQEDRYIIISSLRNRRSTASEITANFNVCHETKISTTTVKRRLLDVGLRGCVSVKKPRLTKAHKQKRLTWAKEHKNWTPEDWNKVLWSDESKFESFGNKRRSFVRRRPWEMMLEECTVQTIKHGGGNIMVWGCFGGGQVGTLVKIDGKMTKEVYLDILKEHVLNCGTELIGEGFFFQQDNDPKHTAKVVKEYLRKKSEEGFLQVMTWPSQSPDCNPIEQLWDHLDREVRKNPPSGKNNLWLSLKSIWEAVDGQYLQKLCDRLPRICQALIKSRGGHFDENSI